MNGSAVLKEARRGGVTVRTDEAAARYASDNTGYWNNRAAGYSGINRAELAGGGRDAWLSLLLERIEGAFGALPSAGRKMTLLDVGTGPGFFAIMMAEAGFTVSAADYTDRMLCEARVNAASRGVNVDFHKMNAEELSFPEGSFDVIVSRNVTWNLYRPEAAYRCWARALRPGGLLLNFDANWYRYLYRADALRGHLRDRELVASTGVRDEQLDEGVDAAAMEAIARRAPLSACDRPEWDRETLSAEGLEVSADLEVWRRVWTPDEVINNGSTPLFMIEARKPV